MKLTDIYKNETGFTAIYRKDGSDYHTLRYVRWLEHKIEHASHQADTADGDNGEANQDILDKFLDHAESLKW